MKKTVSIKTFGCKVNSYDEDILEKKLKEKNFIIKKITNPDALIINSCAVTQEAVKQCISLAQKTKKKSPQTLIVMSGCAAQVEKEIFLTDKHIDLVIDNAQKKSLANILEKAIYKEAPVISLKKEYTKDIFQETEIKVEGVISNHKTRSFLRVQDGCNRYCSYCIIPFARGKSRSVPISEVEKQVNLLQQKNVHEVVLTGIHLGDYGIIKGKKISSIEELVEKLLLHTSIPRIRLGSLEPKEITKDILSLLEEERLCPHIHLSVQSMTDSVLKNMNRKYTSEDVLQALDSLQSLKRDVFVGMDIIAGFHGESEEDFLHTYENMKKSYWQRAHIFPYSSRPGTAAEKLTHLALPVTERKKRASTLRELSSARHLFEAQKQIGKIKQGLVLKKTGKSNFIKSISKDYWNILTEPLENAPIPSGKETLFKIIGVTSHKEEISLLGIPYYS